MLAEDHRFWKPLVRETSTAVTSDPGDHAFLRSGSAQAVDDIAVPKEEQCRYPGDTELLRQKRAVFGIYFYHRGFSCQLRCDFPHHRCEITAVRSPWRPKLCKHQAVIPAYEFGEAPVGQLHRARMERGQEGMTVPAFSRPPFARNRHAIDGAAGRTTDQVRIGAMGHGSPRCFTLSPSFQGSPALPPGAPRLLPPSANA